MSFAEILQKLEDGSVKRLEAKVPSWAGVPLEVPASLNLQQCSGETAARYKASLIPSSVRVADLTGGLGVDSWAFSLRASALWYNERDAVLLEAVKRNFAALGVSNAVFCGYDVSASDTAWLDALRAFAPDVIYLDPARRDAAGRKVFLLEDCSPDVVSLMPQLLSVAPLVMVKVSPMADITMLRRRLAPWLSELHVVGADGECKELLCLCRMESCCTAREVSPETSASLHPSHFASLVGPSRSRSHGRLRFLEAPPASVPPGSIRQYGTNGASIILAEDGVVFQEEREQNGLNCSQNEKFLQFGNKNGVCVPESELLFVPSAAMVKSGLGPGMCRMPYDEELSHFGKFYQVIEDLPFASSVIKELGRRYPQAEVTARGVQVSSEELRKKIRTKPGGPVHIFACVLNNERKILICQQVLRPE
ncbi:MAG: hypothetical protein IKZ51_04960 [Bacteroidales bacterium]|nr:hypothetical protein [Bacteroidales bacterium]